MPDQLLPAEVQSTRSHETRIEIAGPIEDVWRSLTDPAELARWFAPAMRVEPGAGGSVVADWGPGLEWKTAIEVWEPNRHLRLTETRERVLSSSPEEQRLVPCRLVEDFYLEAGAGGKTVLRLVHSGFGSPEDWDNEYDGTRGGWIGCFVRLKHTLERHKGESVVNGIASRIWKGTEPAEALQRIEAALPEGARLEMRAIHHLLAVVPPWNGSILTASVQRTPEGTAAYLEWLVYGMTAERAAAIAQNCRGMLGL